MKKANLKFILEKKANDLRNKWALNNSEPVLLSSLLLELNVITVFKPLSNAISGMALKIQDEDLVHRFIFVNSNHTHGRQRFTVCHELYHLFVQTNFESMICQTGKFDKKDEEEYRADLFASFFLLPKDGIMKLIPDEEIETNSISLSTILKIEHYFLCSRSALLFRLKDLNLIDTEGYNKYAVNVKAGASRLGYDLSLYEPRKKEYLVGDYGRLAELLFEQEKISEGHYGSLMKDIGVNIFENEN